MLLPSIGYILDDLVELHDDSAGRVLVANDQASMLEFTRELLADAGYDVLTAVDGEEALNVGSDH